MSAGVTEASLARQLAGTLLAPDDAARLEVTGGSSAGVLVALYVQDGDVVAILTKRRDDLPRHPGEISFPGGRREPEDADLLHTALREAHEEIALEPGHVRVLGALQPTPTIATDYAVYPFVGLIAPGETIRASPDEVAAVLPLSLAALHAGYARRRVLRRGLPIRTDSYVVADTLVWGATARMLADLFVRLGPLLPASAQRAG